MGGTIHAAAPPIPHFVMTCRLSLMPVSASRWSSCYRATAKPLQGLPALAVAAPPATGCLEGGAVRPGERFLSSTRSSCGGRAHPAPDEVGLL